MGDFGMGDGPALNSTDDMWEIFVLIQIGVLSFIKVINDEAKPKIFGNFIATSLI
jgi:hypothetical protein